MKTSALKGHLWRKAADCSNRAIVLKQSGPGPSLETGPERQHPALRRRQGSSSCNCGDTHRSLVGLKTCGQEKK